MAKGRSSIRMRRELNKNYLIPRTCHHPECREEGIIVWGVYHQRRYHCIHHLHEVRESTRDQMRRLLSA